MATIANLSGVFPASHMTSHSSAALLCFFILSFLFPGDVSVFSPGLQTTAHYPPFSPSPLYRPISHLLWAFSVNLNLPSTSSISFSAATLRFPMYFGRKAFWQIFVRLCLQSPLSQYGPSQARPVQRKGEWERGGSVQEAQQCRNNRNLGIPFFLFLYGNRFTKNRVLLS